MLKPLPPKPARMAGTAREFSVFALVVLAEAVVARRFDLIDTPTLYGCLVAVLVLALAGLVAVAVALTDVWRKGAPGFGHAAVAFVAATLALTPFAGVALAVGVYPELTEVSTDLANPPPFLSDPTRRAPGTAGAEAGRLQAEAYPDLVGRRLPLSTVEAYDLVRQAAVEEGWTILAEQEPVTETDAGFLEAEARSLALGIPDDVAVRVWPDAGSARVDVRSASRMPVHDLGENARRVRRFLAALDEILTRPAD
ncbi:DUF1499 domain-containing protein [Mongoliimonas terrestris]|uniref:DUF1499 domain-containing protein n=1 Tax=Mongoliimonas terrestris TaxID=1709001 RepID=UPI0009498DBD|nr:DUF1499 domain-containing protein [Mongoliimonas terrestris]